MPGFFPLLIRGVCIGDHIRAHAKPYTHTRIIGLLINTLGIEMDSRLFVIRWGFIRFSFGFFSVFTSALSSRCWCCCCWAFCFIVYLPSEGKIRWPGQLHENNKWTFLISIFVFKAVQQNLPLLCRYFSLPPPLPPLIPHLTSSSSLISFTQDHSFFMCGFYIHRLLSAPATMASYFPRP